MQMNKVKTYQKILSFSLVLWLSLWLTACNSSVTLPPQPTATNITNGVKSPSPNVIVPTTEQNEQNFSYKADKTFIFGVTQEPIGLNWKGNPGNKGVGFDPANLSDHASLLITRQVYETLFEFKSKSTGYQYTPFVVKSVLEAEDGLSYTIRMGKGLKFSDGSVLDAEAVKFNFQRWANPASIFHKGDFSAWGHYFGGFPGNLDLDNLQVLASNELKIILKRPMANFYQVLAMPQFGLVALSSFDANGNFIPAKPIGSGAYKIERQERSNEKYVVLTANLNYTIERDANGIQPVYLKTVVMQVLKDKQDPLKEVREGRISATNVSRLEEYAVAANQNDPLFEMKLRTPLSLSFLSFNLSRQPFNQLEVRQAFAYAINTRLIVRDYYYGLGKVASSFLPPDVFAARSDLEPYPYDPEKAKQLLQQVNYNALQTTPLELWVMPVPRPYYPDPNKIADAIISDLNKVGVQVVKKNSDTWVNFQQNRADGKYSFYMNGWQGENGDPDEFFSKFWLNPTKDIGYDNPLLRQVVDDGAKQINPTNRRPYYSDAQGIIYNDVAVLPIAYMQTPIAIRRDIVGYDPNPTGIEAWGYLNFVSK